MIARNNYISDEEWQRFLDFSKDLETPNVVINLRSVKENYLELAGAFPYAKIYYAVKANPAKQVVSLLAELGANFDLPPDTS